MTIFNTEEFQKRFTERANAVRKRAIPPVGGDELNAFIKQAEVDLIDFSIIADADIEVTNDELILKIKLDN